MSFPNYIVFISEVIAALSIIFGAVVTANRLIIRPITKHLREVKEQLEKVNVIYAELQPNSGGSLKDAVNQIRNTVHTIEKRQRAWLSYEDQGIFETDENGRLIWSNRAYLKMLNVTFEEVQGNGWKNFIHPSNKEYVFEEWTAAVADKRDCKMAIKYLTATNEDVCATAEAFAIKDDLGKLTGYVGVVTVHPTLDRCR